MSYEMLMTDLIHALHDSNASYKGYRQQERVPGTYWWYLNNMTHIYNIRIVMGMCHDILQD